VYGEPAIAVAIDRRVQVTVEEHPKESIRIASSLGAAGVFRGEAFRHISGGPYVRRTLEPVRISAQSVLDRLGVKRGLDLMVESTIPVAVGLGSSSATAVATVAAVGKLFGAKLLEKDIVELSLGAEEFVHGNPSGIDQSVSTYGGVLVYRRGEGVTKLDSTPALSLVIGNTGQSRNTGKLVDSVRQRRARLPSIMDQLIRTAGDLAHKGVSALNSCDLVEFGELMDIDHGLLIAAGVSIEALDRLVYAAKHAGALGAKLTGAGGGGCIVALCMPETRAMVAKAIRTAGGEPILAEKVDMGVEAWIEE